MKTKPVLTVLVAAAVALGACASLEGRDTSRIDDAAATGSSDDGSTEAQPSDAQSAATAAAASIGPFNTRRAMDHVRRLARRIGVRRRGRYGEYLGAQYIARRFRAYGYNVLIRRFSVDGKTSRNVIAFRPDGIRDRFVIGGHMDSVPGSPGANDNASGVAIILEVARLFAGDPRTKFVRFVAFGSEEYGTDGRHHVGSSNYVAKRTAGSRRRIPGMVSADMIADGKPLLVGTSGIGPEVVARTLYRKIKSAGIAVSYRTLCDCSDNGPFEHAGIPAAFMWSGYEPNYHDPSDTVPNLNPKHLNRSGRALVAFMKGLNRDLISRFRRY